MKVSETSFLKYENRGSYHWEQISPSIRKHNAFLVARYYAVLEALGDIRGKKILDIGGGDGVSSYFMLKRGAYVINIDISETGLQLAQIEFKRRGLTAQVAMASAYKVPFQECIFDAVTCLDVIEHLQSPYTLVTEATRVLKPGGLLILTTPLRMTEKPADPVHVHEFIPNELGLLISKIFSDLSITAFGPIAFLELYNLRFRLFMNRPLFRYVINIMDSYLKINPFRISSHFKYFSMLIAVTHKPLTI